MVWGYACGLDIVVRIYFLSLFPLCQFSHFPTSMYRQWVPCERNSSYSFIPIFLKLCTCFLHGLKMCIWFGYNPCVNFCHFFHFVNFVIFWPQILCKCIDSGYLVSATPHTLLYWSFLNFAHVFSIVLRCACGLDIILELIFVTFFTLWTLSFSDLRLYRQWVPFKRNSLYSFNPFFMQLCTSFFHGLKMCMWFGFNPAVNFCHFSALLTLSFFNFLQVRHQLHRSSIYIFSFIFYSLTIWIWKCHYLCPLQIELGSTNVRVGSTIFGARDYGPQPPQTEAPPPSTDCQSIAEGGAYLPSQSTSQQPESSMTREEPNNATNCDTNIHSTGGTVSSEQQLANTVDRLNMEDKTWSYIRNEWEHSKTYKMTCATAWQNQQNDCAPSEDSDQPGNLPSLISLRCALNG